MNLSQILEAEALRAKAFYDLRHAFDRAASCAGMPEGDENEGGEEEEEVEEVEEEEKEPIKDPDKKKLSDEAAAHRTRAKAAEKARDEALAKLRELEDKDKSESEKNARDAAEEKAKRQKAEARLKEQAVKLAFFECGAAALFHDSADALLMLAPDLKDVAPDEDGEVDAKVIRQKADDLLKRKPYLAIQAGDDAEHSSSGAGGTSGRPANGKKDRDQLNREALEKKFPALRR